MVRISSPDLPDDTKIRCDFISQWDFISHLQDRSSKSQAVGHETNFLKWGIFTKRGNKELDCLKKELVSAKNLPHKVIRLSDEAFTIVSD